MLKLSWIYSAKLLFKADMCLRFSLLSWCPIFISRILNLLFIIGFLNFTMMNAFINLLSLLEKVKFWSIIIFNSKPWSLSMMLCCRLFRINKNEWIESFGIPSPKEPLWKMRNYPMINTWITGKSSEYSYFDTTTIIQCLISQKPSNDITYLMAVLHKLLSRDFLAHTHLSLIIDTHNNLTGVICFLHAILKHISF